MRPLLCKTGYKCNIVEFSSDSGKTTESKKSFNDIQYSGFLNGRRKALMRGWNSSLTVGIFVHVKQRHCDIQTLCNRVKMCCLNWMDCFGFLFIFIISLGIYSTWFLSFTSCTIKDVSQIIIFVLISQTLLIDSLQCVFQCPWNTKETS